MSAKDKFERDYIFDDYYYKNEQRMARVRDELLYEPVTIKVSFLKNDGYNVWLIDHEEEGFEFAHEAFERGAEWVEEGIA